MLSYLHHSAEVVWSPAPSVVESHANAWLTSLLEDYAGDLSHTEGRFLGAVSRQDSPCHPVSDVQLVSLGIFHYHFLIFLLSFSKMNSQSPLCGGGVSASSFPDTAYAPQYLHSQLTGPGIEMIIGGEVLQWKKVMAEERDQRSRFIIGTMLPATWGIFPSHFWMRRYSTRAGVMLSVSFLLEYASASAAILRASASA